MCTTASVAAAETVTQAWQSESGEFQLPVAVSVSVTDGSCWVADRGRLANPFGGDMNLWTDCSVTHLSASGGVLWHGGTTLSAPYAVSADPEDGSCWVDDAAYLHDTYVLHLSEGGAELWASHGPSDSTWSDTQFYFPRAVSVDAHDGSCWVADTGHSQVVHLAADGTERWRGSDFSYPVSVSANSADGSCWVADGTQVVHLSATGAELWRSPPPPLPEFSGVLSVCVNPADGSCWVAADDVVHLSESGTELWRSTGSPEPQFVRAMCVSVNPVDGSCWVAEGGSTSGTGAVVHLSNEGTELWRGPAFTPPPFGPADGPSYVSVDPSDGSCWVADGGTGGADTPLGQVVHLAVRVEFSDVPYYHWAFHQVDACYAAGIVSGYAPATYRPDLQVTRDQMAAYISRALAGGDGSVQVPSGLAEPSFGDVDEDQWAYRYIEYCAGAGIVQGYSDGTYHPDEVVNRGQMAVYIARSAAIPAGEAGVPEVPAGTPPSFTDVTADNEWAWCYKHVEYCAAEGVVQGYADGSYHPGEAVTRDQMAVYIQRAFHLPM